MSSLLIWTPFWKFDIFCFSTLMSNPVFEKFLKNDADNWDNEYSPVQVFRPLNDAFFLFECFDPKFTPILMEHFWPCNGITQFKNGQKQTMSWILENFTNEPCKVIALTAFQFLYSTFDFIKSKIWTDYFQAFTLILIFSYPGATKFILYHLIVLKLWPDIPFLGPFWNSHA